MCFNNLQDEQINSDFDYTMLASNAFDYLLNQIRSSNLNFHLQMSPFSAIVSIKKSLIKDKSGLPLLPKLTTEQAHTDKIAMLVEKI